MNFHETMLFYLVFGVVVAGAYALVERSTSAIGRGLSLGGAVLFWPLYLPLILSRRGEGAAVSFATAPPADDLATAIEQIDRELRAAFAGLDATPVDGSPSLADRIAELRTALAAQADRIRSMEAIVARERLDADFPETPAATTEDASEAEQRGLRSRQARRENMQQLAEVCRRSRSDLRAVFAWVRELISMIHLARFTGAPTTRADELMAQIAAAVESLSTSHPAAIA